MNVPTRRSRSFFFWLVLAHVLSSALHAQTFTQVRDTGPRANRLNVILMAEGYTAAESAK